MVRFFITKKEQFILYNKSFSLLFIIKLLNNPPLK